MQLASEDSSKIQVHKSSVAVTMNGDIKLLYIVYFPVTGTEETKLG